MYLEEILKRSKGSALLPFLLQFLCSDCSDATAAGDDSNGSSASSISWPWTNGESLWQGVAQALEQSFPLAEASFYRGQTSRHPNPHPKSYMDLILKRIHNCNTVVSILTWLLIISSSVKCDPILKKSPPPVNRWHSKVHSGQLHAI